LDNFCFHLALRVTTVPSPCALLPCFHGGKCSETSVGGFVCVCLPTFTGVRCEDFVTTFPIPPITITTMASTMGQIIRTTDVCTDNPCLNAGSCTPNGVGGFLCTCLNGFVGNRCEARGK
jgi:hypothetical protein